MNDFYKLLTVDTHDLVSWDFHQSIHLTLIEVKWQKLGQWLYFLRAHVLKGIYCYLVGFQPV